MGCHANNGKQVAFNLVSCTYRAIMNFVADVRWRVLYKSAARSVAQVGIECGVGSTLGDWLLLPSIIGEEASPVTLAGSDGATLAAQGVLEKVVAEHVVVETHAAEGIACWREGVLRRSSVVGSHVESGRCQCGVHTAHASHATHTTHAHLWHGWVFSR
jgi:hypothetical protein